jgi:hypothetical protein
MRHLEDVRPHGGRGEWAPWMDGDRKPRSGQRAVASGFSRLTFQ